MSTGYAEFLASKQRTWTGESIPLTGSLPARLYPFQVALVEWALRKGRCALWAGTGLGKTSMQLAWAEQVARQGGRVLIFAPLAVSEQTVREGVLCGITVTSARTQADAGPGITITNYERLDRFDLSQFTGVVLDESGILKSYSGSTKQALVTACAGVRYRLCCTATPAPNDYLELGNHAEFLGVMPSNEMIMRWFTNDPMQAGRYTLKGHGAKDFWRWLASWAMSLERPSDIGYEDGGFVLPPLDIRHASVGHVETPAEPGRLFAEPAVSATNLHVTMRASAKARAEAAAAVIAAEPNESWLVWVNTDYDAAAMRDAMDGLTEVKGPDAPEKKAATLLAFADGEVRALMTKPSIAGYGMNFQVCARVVFVGLSFSFEQFYQAVRRSWRYGQTRPVAVVAFLSDNEATVLQAIQDKQAQHITLMREMISASREAVMGELAETDALVTRPVRMVAEGERWRLMEGDCVEALAKEPEQSIDYSVFSPPFSNLYIYSDAVQDMGNASNHGEFFDHFAFLARELFRLTVDGRLCSIHCKDLPRFQNSHGAAGLFDFAGETIRVFEAAGWQYHSRVTIWKDPVIEMQRTNNHGLLYKQLRKDSAASRQGMADYLVTFRKWNGVTKLAEFPKPIAHTREEFPLDQWQSWASPVWDDIQQTRVLAYQQGREDSDERHICPLQLDVIERCIRLWSNPGDVVLSPFAGIGSEGYEALRLGRRFLGVELKPSYARVAARHLAEAATMHQQDGLFAGIDAEATA